MFDIKTLDSHIKEADYHIKSLESISGVLRDIKFSLEELRNQKEDLYLEELKSVKQEVQDLATQLKLRGLPLADEYEKEFRKIEALVKDDKWPVAINPEYIVVTKEDEEKRAKTLGNVTNLKKYMIAADVFIMPSTEEGFGVAAIEAMASGLPCILSDVVALSDFKKKIKGISYVNLNTKSIMKAMLKYNKLSKSERFKIGEKLSKQSKKHYGLSVGPIKCMKLYRRLSPKSN